ncbi:MAG: hypothetical protein K2O91_02675, partial [Lachnospiraceae bacterium]|nr:hypothetical protein [Lachnospiraceae bacterium]
MDRRGDDNVIKYLKKYWIFAVLAPVFMAGEVMMDLIQPRLMSTIVDEGVLGLSNGNAGDLQMVISTVVNRGWVWRCCG